MGPTEEAHGAGVMCIGVELCQCGHVVFILRLPEPWVKCTLPIVPGYVLSTVCAYFCVGFTYIFLINCPLYMESTISLYSFA